MTQIRDMYMAVVRPGSQEALLSFSKAHSLFNSYVLGTCSCFASHYYDPVIRVLHGRTDTEPQSDLALAQGHTSSEWVCQELQ